MFEQTSFLSLPFRNQILIPPLIENQANSDGTINGIFSRYYKNLARQGASSIILESAYVAKQGRSHICQLGLSEEEHLEGLSQLVAEIKREGVLVGIRLSHTGAKTSEDICGEQPIGPSVINFGKDFSVSREFDAGDCEEMKLFFVHAAERAEEIGADFIEINGAQQYLLDQCLSLRYNNRDDPYGSNDMASRLRLATEIVEAVRLRLSRKMPIGYYFAIHDKLEDGFTADDLKEMIHLLEASGVDLFHPSAIHVMNKFFETDETLVEWVSKYTDKPLIAEGNIKSPQVLKEIYSLGKAQLYALDKALLARPQWYEFVYRKLSAVEEAMVIPEDPADA